MRRSTPARLLMMLVGLAVVALILVWKGSEGPEAGRTRHASRLAEDGDPALVASGGADATARDEASAEQSSIEIPSWPVGEAEVAGNPDGRVHVKLVDHAGQPLPNHPIAVDWWKAFGQDGSESGATDDAGRFRTSANAAWEIDSVSIPSPRTEVPHTYHSGPFIAAPDAPHEVVVQLPTTCLIRGRVLDQNGAPRGGEPVVRTSRRALAVAPFLHRLGTDEQQVATGEDGTFEFLVLAGHHQVELLDESAHAVPMHAEVNVSASRRVADVVLRLLYPLEGPSFTVHLTGFDDPGAGVHVSVVTDKPLVGEPQASPGVRYESQSTFLRASRKSKGLFIVPHLPPGKWRVVVSAPRMRPRSVDVPRGADEVTVDLEPEPDRTRIVRIVGRLPDGGTTSPSRQVYERGGGWYAVLAKGGGTQLELDRLRPKPIHVALRVGGLAITGVGPLDARTAPELIEVRLEPAQEGRVEVVDAKGRPVASEVRLRPSWQLFQTLDGTPPREGFAPRSLDVHRMIVSDGRARFRDIGSAPYLAIATPTDTTLPPARGVLRAGETLRLVLGSGLDGLVSLNGRVLDAATGAPLRGAAVSAWTDPKHGEETYAETLCDADGRFVLSGLAPQKARIRVRHLGYAAPARRRVDLTTLKEPLEVRLHRARLLPLQIVDRSGTPIQYAAVFARWPTGEQVEFHDQYGNADEQEVETDANGRVDLRGLPAVRVKVMIRGPYEDAEQARAHELDLREPVRGLVKLVLD
ncbi:MAG: carboxypeptidase-like regulatory domain-containing protein [Planctomycetota bacterium]|nr:carboxypeptidase-like regulatory domain-containing protein [Planctomycetota bacterium]